jgi:uncharacterized coiled-coil DUF342 family protein
LNVSQKMSHHESISLERVTEERDELLELNQELENALHRLTVERDELLDENASLRKHIDDLMDELRTLQTAFPADRETPSKKSKIEF